MSSIPIVTGIIERCEMIVHEIKGFTSKRQTSKNYKQLTKELDNIQQIVTGVTVKYQSGNRTNAFGNTTYIMSWLVNSNIEIIPDEYANLNLFSLKKKPTY